MVVFFSLIIAAIAAIAAAAAAAAIIVTVMTIMVPMVRDAITQWISVIFVEQIMPFTSVIIDHVILAFIIAPLALINVVTDAVEIFAGVKPVYNASLSFEEMENIDRTMPQYLMWFDEYYELHPYPVEDDDGSDWTLVKSTWQMHIQSNASIVVRPTEDYTNPRRYAPNVREFIEQSNIEFGGDEMYRVLSNALLMGAQIGSGVSKADIPVPPVTMTAEDAEKAMLSPKIINAPLFPYSDPKEDEGIYLIFEAQSYPGWYTDLLFPFDEITVNAEVYEDEEADGNGEINVIEEIQYIPRELTDDEKKIVHYMHTSPSLNAKTYNRLFDYASYEKMLYPDYLEDQLKYLRENPTIENIFQLSTLESLTFINRATMGTLMEHEMFAPAGELISNDLINCYKWYRSYVVERYIDDDDFPEEWSYVLPFFYYWPSNGAFPTQWPEIIIPGDEDEENEEEGEEGETNEDDTEESSFIRGMINPNTQTQGDAGEGNTGEDGGDESESGGETDGETDGETGSTEEDDGIIDIADQASWREYADFYVMYSYTEEEDPEFIKSIWEQEHEFTQKNISIFCFFPGNILWVDFIQNNADIVADHTLTYDDISRYTPIIRDFISFYELTPGTGLFYSILADAIFNGEMEVGEKALNRWLPEDFGYTPYTDYEGVNAGSDIIKVSQGMTILDLFLENELVKFVFWVITILSIALCIGFSIYAVVRSMGDLEVKKPIGKVLGLIGKSMLTFLIIPFFVVAVVSLSGMLMRSLSELMAGRNEEGVTVSGALFAAAISPESVLPPGKKSMYNSYEVKRVSMEAGDNVVSLYMPMPPASDHFRFTPPEARYTRYDQLVAKYRSMRIDFSHIAQMRTEFEVILLAWPGQLLIMAIGAWIILILIVSTLFIFIKRIFDIVMLYLISPFFTATIPLDDGAVFKRWREKFIGACVSGLGTMTTFYIFVLLLPVIWARGFHMTGNVIIDNVLKLLLTIGAVFTVFKSHTLIAELISPAAVQSDKEAFSLGSAMTGNIIGKPIELMESISAPAGAAGAKVSQKIFGEVAGKAKGLVKSGGSSAAGAGKNTAMAAKDAAGAVASGAADGAKELGKGAAGAVKDAAGGAVKDIAAGAADVAKDAAADAAKGIATGVAETAADVINPL